MTKDGDQAVHTDKRETIRDDLRVWRTRDVAYVITPEKGNCSSFCAKFIARVNMYFSSFFKTMFLH